MDEIGPVDTLFLLVGGFYTIGPEEGRKVMGALRPKMTVPMHYRVPCMSTAFNVLSGVEDFLRTGDNVRRLESRGFTAKKTDLHERGVIIVPKLS